MQSSQPVRDKLQELAAKLRIAARELQNPRKDTARRDVALVILQIGADLEVISRVPPFRIWEEG